jgi:hypothetical protein
MRHPARLGAASSRLDSFCERRTRQEHGRPAASDWRWDSIRRSISDTGCVPEHRSATDNEAQPAQTPPEFLTAVQESYARLDTDEDPDQEGSEPHA